MKNVISFSLWGNIRVYCIGAIKNVILAQNIFPDWICRFYYDETVPTIIIDKLRSYYNVELVFMKNKSGGKLYRDPGNFGLIWRASVMSDPTVDYYMICDTDSRLNFYFKFAFEEMLKQNKTFFRFIDLPKHTSPNPYTIYGCGYGGKANIINNIEQDIDRYMITRNISRTHSYFYFEMDFLRDIIYPQLKDSCLTLPRMKHTYPEYFINEIMGKFIGEVVDEYDIRLNKVKGTFEYKNKYGDLEDLLKQYEYKVYNIFKQYS